MCLVMIVLQSSYQTAKCTHWTTDLIGVCSNNLLMMLSYENAKNANYIICFISPLELNYYNATKDG